MTSRMCSNFGYVAELAALERLEKSPWTYYGKTVVATLAPLFFIGSSSFLQGNKDNHVSDGFESYVQPDPTSDCGVSCP